MTARDDVIAAMTALIAKMTGARDADATQAATTLVDDAEAGTTEQDTGNGEAARWDRAPLERFNPYHAPAGSAAGGQFTAGGGGGTSPKQAKAKSNEARKQRLLTQAHAARAKAKRLQGELAKLVARLKKQGGHAGSSPASAAAAASTRHGHQSAGKAKAAKANKGVHHRQAALHHRKAATHHRQARHVHQANAPTARHHGLQARISDLRAQIHDLLAHAAELEAQARKL